LNNFTHEDQGANIEAEEAVTADRSGVVEEPLVNRKEKKGVKRSNTLDL